MTLPAVFIMSTLSGKGLRNIDTSTAGIRPKLNIYNLIFYLT